MTDVARLLNSRTERGRYAPPVGEDPLGTVALTTGGLMLAAAALSMVGPLFAALLIVRSGGGPSDTAATMPLVLLTVAVVVAVTASLGLFVTAWRRAHEPVPAKPRRGAGPGPGGA
ncbi:hypothetical protein GV794_22255 [Nocardia cyriacigeorgica]|uniref:Uncharacterized protein n=1 Tax=Nocardia cyriacigeorgica TaxID=135487 RepID=A0A6P1D9N2_9NOCA|nr:hypothetical protein [Nocardia cyriacigeorgica]NEW40027.1 hypothetical protein [Nocardia cyriacigeorgica]NEW46818.1 hypothetical protein [Nocardia cyriacigeorgica]NEW53641.1 hypothetical protein [Nocardia cyriacigeorgica]NEW58349.1 hypothetical protein [Nocardia cyriacigeorgica]